MDAGVPKGERHLCACGGLLVHEQSERGYVLHHSLPLCKRYEEEALARAEFLTLSAATEAERDAALAGLTPPDESPAG